MGRGRRIGSTGRVRVVSALLILIPWNPSRAVIRCRTLRWTTKSKRVLSAELHRLGHQAGRQLGVAPTSIDDLPEGVIGERLAGDGGEDPVCGLRIVRRSLLDARPKVVEEPFGERDRRNAAVCLRPIDDQFTANLHRADTTCWGGKPAVAWWFRCGRSSGADGGASRSDGLDVDRVQDE